MKCLISVGLILPALAAIIGVAAWAVSADVVMNANGNRVNKADNQLIQGMSEDRRNDGRRDIFQDNHINRNPEPREHDIMPERPHTERTTRRTTTLAPTKSSADVSDILSKLISASNAASGNSGPRFVVVAPLPDHAKVVSNDEDSGAISGISRADHQPTAKFEESWKPTRYEENSDHDLLASASRQKHQKVIYPPASFHKPLNNITNRVGLTNNNKQTNHRRTGDQQPTFVIDLSTNNKRRNFNSPVDLSGFEPFMSPESLLGSSSVVAGPPPPQVPGFMATGPFKNRNPQSGYLNSPRDPPKHPMFNEPYMHNHNPPGGFGFKPIQQHHSPMHHLHDAPLAAAESNHWGAVSFHPPPSLHIPKPPEGISLSISSPEKSHISAEPVSVIKSFFLPFLPKPKLNMNARVVFGVVLDKGVGLGGQKKDAGHLRPY